MFNTTEYHRNYRKEKLKRISLEIQKEFYETIKEHTQTTNETVNGFIKRAIKETIENDKRAKDNN